MPTLVHFEIPADNLDRAKKFYTDLFNWQFEQCGVCTEAGEYLMISTTDEQGNKGVMGGMMPRQNPEQRITNYIDVPSIEEYSKKVLAQGGQIVVPKTTIPNTGYFAVCLDTEQNSFGLWQTDEAAK